MKRDHMAEGVDRDRRRFLGSAALTMTAAHLGMFGPPSPLRGFGGTGPSSPLGGFGGTGPSSPLGGFGGTSSVEAQNRPPRELAAIGRATEWLNSPRLSAESLLGKVVVVDFCTYTCINWLRTLPYVRAWAQKYTRGRPAESAECVVIGVHTPEFPFEKNVESVRTPARVGSS